MDIVTIDFETYYSKEFSLGKLTTEQYVRDPRFEVIGVGIKINNNPTDFYTGSDPESFLKSIDYSGKAILCHNTAFDGAILSWHYGIKPKLWLDTLSMSKPYHKTQVGGSLAKLAKHYGIGEKGTEVVNALGKRRADFSDEDMRRYAEYCCTDVDLTYELFRRLVKGFPQKELLVIDQIIRMYTEPTIKLDKTLLANHLYDVRHRKESLLEEAGVDQKDLSSNPKFAKLLESLGVTPPMKTSPRTGKLTYAFAKTDQGILDLLNHDNPDVSTLVAARLGTKSTIEETRTENLMGVADRGALPVMLNYYGAHTGRFSGGDGLNMQNLPARGNNTIRRSLCAPEGYTFIACDLSQIEARMLAWAAEQMDLVESFAKGEDVYSVFATDVYGRQVTKQDKVERFVGKTCLSASTRVLTRSGWKPILSVTTEDELWDGVEWVNHQGVSFMGVKPTINLHGLELTTDHEILTEHTKWETAQYAQDHNHAFQSAVSLANSSLSGMKNTLQKVAKRTGGGDLYANADYAETYLQCTGTTYEQVDLNHATNALNGKPQTKDGGNTNPLWGMTCIEPDYSTGYLAQYQGVTTQSLKLINITGSVVSRFIKSGERIEQLFLRMFKRLTDGTTQTSRWIESTLIKGIVRTISDLFLGKTTYRTNEESKILKPVYDILNAGSRHRFTVLTDKGPIIVHNCILGLGYGVGALKLQRTLELGQGGVNVIVDDNEAKRIVMLYRQKNHRIIRLWKMCDYALGQIMQGSSGELCPAVTYDAKGIRLPSGFYIQYPQLTRGLNGYKYIDNPRSLAKPEGDRKDTDWVHIYGGKVVENVIQGLASCVIREHMLNIGKRYKCVLQVHDEVVALVPKGEEEEAERFIVDVMSTAPDWCSDLPVACEASVADTYGDCK